jgi:peptide-methionine (S)-S-oxide reductase
MTPFIKAYKMALISYILLAGLMAAVPQAGPGSAHPERNPAMTEPSDPNSVSAAKPDPNSAIATFAAGCFWGVEHFFADVPGVVSTEVGYMGGTTKNPTYKDVCRGDTYHAEVVHLRYDPNQVRYDTLVKLFFKMHDPTTRNRQGPDVGSQYRSAIFFHTDDQKQTAQAVIRKLTADHVFKRRIVTQVAPAAPFWKAEDYHQHYFKKNPGRSCHTNFCPALLE